MSNKKTIDTIHSDAAQFLRMKNVFDLSRLFPNLEFSRLVYEIENASYKEFTIPKTTGGKRTIEAPNEKLLYIQRRLNMFLQAVYYTIKPNEVYGFVQAAMHEANPRTIISNAQNHIAKEYVLNIDLKDFFHSISAVKVRALFTAYPFKFSNDLATGLALICCWKKRLPMGAPTSPVISNLICLQLDKQLLEVANEHCLVYSRYADDLSFSTNNFVSEGAVDDIKKVIEENDFKVNERKLRLQSKYLTQTVTGIKVNQKTNVGRPYIRNIRAILNDINWNGIEKAACKHYKVKAADEKLVNTFLLSVRGKINFIGEVRGKGDMIYIGLRQGLNKFQEVKI